MFGAHLSIARGLHNALLAAERLHCDTLQLFTKNQQQWKCAPLTQFAIDEWNTQRKRMKLRQTILGL